MNVGVDSATCDHACIMPFEIWKKNWSLIDTKFGARTIEENEQISKEPKSKKRFNVSHEPLFPTIPLTNVVIDNLHLFLRVFDVLMRLLIDELKRQDSIAAAKKFAGSFDILKQNISFPHLVYQIFTSMLDRHHECLK